MARKTVDVSWLRDKANDFLRDSADNMRDERKGVAALLESALFETGNYKGFSYRISEWDEVAGELKVGYDSSRRYYY